MQRNKLYIRRKDILMKKLLILLILLMPVRVWADLTGTEGLAIDLSSAGAGTDFTIAFDPTELFGNRTWGDASTDTIVWTFNRATGTDPTITFNNGSIALLALTLTTDLAVAEGGTGASTFTDGGPLLGSGAGAITAMAVLSDGEIIIGDGTTDPVALDVGSSTAITILGTIATGVWQGTAIADAYIPDNITIDLATLATTVTITDNESTNENNALVFLPNGDLDGGDLGLETDGNLYYNPSTGTLESTLFTKGGQVMYDADDVPGGELGGTFASFTIDDSVAVTNWNLTTPTITDGMDINLAADDNIVIDGRSNPRTVTVGAIRINLTPEASTPNTRAVFIDVDAASVPNTQAVHIDMKATSIAAGETITGIDIVGDTANSSGGVIRLIELDKTGVGSAEVHGIHIEPEIEEVIHHASGTFIDPTQGWDENGGFTDITTAFGSSGTDVTIFSANADAIYIGSDAVFQAVEVVLDTGATNPGIKPTFEIWTGAAWTIITPVDGTAGFRENGIIDMEDVDLSSWAATAVNSVSKYYLRITRTQGGSLTVIEDLVQTAAVIDYIWDKDGNLNIKGLTTTTNTKGEPKHLVFTIINPLATQTEDNEICLWKAVPAALTVTKIEVTLDASGNEVAGDLKWADAFIGLAGATVINVFDTSSGVLVDSSITAGSVGAGKCMYLAFDSAPNTAITQMNVDITFDYD